MTVRLMLEYRPCFFKSTLQTNLPKEPSIKTMMLEYYKAAGLPDIFATECVEKYISYLGQNFDVREK